MADKLTKDDLMNVNVNTGVLQEVFGVSDRMIRILAEQGIIEKTARGKYPLLKNVKNYITTLKVANQGKDIPAEGGSNLDLDEEKAMHEHVKRQITEIKLQLMKGQVHKAEDVEAVMTDMFAKFKSKIESLPAKLAKELEGEDRIAMQRILKVELDEALDELSSYNPQDFYSDEHIEIGNDVINNLIDEVNNGS